MPKSLQSRKRKLVSDAIYEAAIDMFTEKGFDGTTIEEIAERAGISRRSFFRYFASKDDLLTENIGAYGAALSASISACSAACTQLEVLRQTVLVGVKFADTQPRHRQTIEIATRSPSARHAYMSRRLDLEDIVAAAFAKRIKCASRDKLRPRILANLTLALLHLAVMAWFRGECPDMASAANLAFSNLSSIFCEGIRVAQDAAPASPRKSRRTSHKG